MAAFELTIAVRRDPADKPEAGRRREAAPSIESVVTTLEVSSPDGALTVEDLHVLMQRIEGLFEEDTDAVIVCLQHNCGTDRTLLKGFVEWIAARRVESYDIRIAGTEPHVHERLCEADAMGEVVLPLGADGATGKRRVISAHH